VLHEVTAGEAGLLVMLFPQLAGLDIAHIEDLGDGLRITARTAAVPAACRDCGTVSARVHERYWRYPADLACGGRPVRIALQVRRFRCVSPGCPAGTFTEQVPGLTAWYQRRTVRLRELLEKTALALAGRAGARMAAAMGAEVSRTTLIRLIRALPDPVCGPVAVLGVDDIAKRKGHSYATVLMDMETHQLTGMLPDREAGTFADWLRAHPGTEVICRDRAGAYARAARDAAPVAVQVADRFHLMQNLGGAIEKTVVAVLAVLAPPPPGPQDPDPQDPADPQDPDPQDAADAQDPDPADARDAAVPAGPGPGVPAVPDGFRDVNGRDRRVVARHRERYAQVQALLAGGATIAGAAARLGLDPGTAARFAHAGSISELLVKATSRASILDPYKPYLGQRWNQGTCNAAVLHQEIRAQGWTGSVMTVSRYLSQFRTAGSRRAQPQLTAPVTPRPPRPRTIAAWIMTRPGRLDPAHAAELARLLDASPRLAAAAAHARSFHDIMTRRQGMLCLEQWLTAVETDDQPQLHSFTRGIRRDQEAVTAGLSLDDSSGALEGSNCKTKYIKRLMYGRANFDLLRKMALLN
jgi:transposase